MTNGCWWIRFVRVPAVIVAISGPRVTAAQQIDAPPPPPLSIPASEIEANRHCGIPDAIARLASPDFAERQAAQQLLVAAGGDAVPALTEGAQSDEREVAIRCVAILRELARDEQHAESALQALKHLAANEDILLARHAGRVYGDLTQSKLDRAIALLTGAGVHLHDPSRGRVGLARNLRSDWHLSQLTHFPDLHMVQATGPRVTDGGLQSLSQLSKLFSVELVQTSVTGAGLRHLQASPRLMSLTLTADRLSVDDLRQLKHLPRLQSLSLTSLAHEGQLEFLEEVEQINRLELGTVRLSREGIDMLNRHANLRRVGLTLVDAGDEQLRDVSRLNTELTLTVRHSPDLTDAGWECLAGAGIRRLTILQSSVTDAGMASIARCENLEYLTVYDAPLSDAALDHLRALRRLKYLTLGMTQVTEEGRKRLKKARPTLQIR